MITLIEALNYRCLRYVRQSLGRFQVLVGPNASGKTTFLDVPAFMGDLVSAGLERTLERRTTSFRDLIWMNGDRERRIEMAIEARIPDERRKERSAGFDTVRYELSLGQEGKLNEVRILAENAWLLNSSDQAAPAQGGLFPVPLQPPETIIGSKQMRNGVGRKIMSKVPGGNDNYTESHGVKGKGWMPSIKLGPAKSTLGNLPEDETTFPVLTWLKNTLSNGIQRFMLNSVELRKASPPGQGKGFRTDGSNLPWVISGLAKTNSGRFKKWIRHLQTAFPDLTDVQTIEQKDDKHRYLNLVFDKRLRVPSWTASDGTLRLLALTLPAYLADCSGVFLIEEPENGMHPRSVEAVIQALKSVYGAQVLLATHSPIVLSLVKPSEILCFAKPGAETSVVEGSRHPSLSSWQGSPNLSVLFAGGVLG